RVARFRSRTAGAVGAEIRDRGDVLHAPQVRSQAVPRAVHGAALHSRLHADRADVPLRTSVGEAIATTMPVFALLHPFTQLGWLAWSIHPSTVVGIAALAAIYLWRGRYA